MDGTHGWTMLLTKVEVFYQKMAFSSMMCDLLLHEVAHYYVPNWKLRLGDKAFRIMEKHRPSWFPYLMGNVHRFRPVEFKSLKQCSYAPEPIKILHNHHVKYTELEVNHALRNLKAIMDSRSEHAGMINSDPMQVIHPEPRMRM
mmetsp:Transcript_5192/g.10290  ORF Transcript_5192/g.10290 Transcript_5192/m.10290 type:complete len:144 (-) Transcript_5192:178-609(-)